VNDALNRAGAWITRVVGTMWCAIVFAGIALVSLPGALATHDVVVIGAWVAQTLLQLVLLSVIMVGQSLASAKTDTTIQETHDRVTAILAEHADQHDDTHELLRDVHALMTAVHVAVAQSPAGAGAPPPSRPTLGGLS